MGFPYGLLSIDISLKLSTYAWISRYRFNRVSLILVIALSMLADLDGRVELHPDAVVCHQGQFMEAGNTRRLHGLGQVGHHLRPNESTVRVVSLLRSC